MDAEILDKIITLTKERDELRQKLEAIGKQNPAAYVLKGYATEKWDGDTLISLLDAEFCDEDALVPLYTKPLPAVAVSDDIYKKVSVWYARLTCSDAVIDDDEHVGYCCTMKMLDEMEDILSAAPSHSQKIAENPEMDLYNAAASVVRAIENSTGYEPSISVRARAVDTLRRALQIYDRCPSHESEQSPEGE